MSNTLKFLGGYIPEEMDQSITLYGVVHDLNRSETVRSIVSEWREKQVNSQPVLMQKLASILLHAWGVYAIESREMHISKRDFLEQELRKQRYAKLSDYMKEDILKLCGV
jgi:hypothetical protein